MHAFRRRNFPVAVKHRIAALMNNAVTRVGTVRFPLVAVPKSFGGSATIYAGGPLLDVLSNPASIDGESLPLRASMPVVDMR
jgi:hypothetical protein